MRTQLSLFPVAAACISAVFLAAPAVHAQDTDADGVANAADAFPCDVTASSVQSVPASNTYASLMFEDLWPAQGDFDFNDVVVDYNIQITRNAQNQATSAMATFFLRAHGAKNNSGLAWHLPISASNIQSMTRVVNGGASTNITNKAGENEAVAVIFNNIRQEAFGNPVGFINTDTGLAQNAGARVVVNIKFATPIALNGADAPFDVFIFDSLDYGRQIHRTRFAGTTLMNQSFFGREDDGSSPVGTPNGRFFVDQRGVPFVLEVPQSAVYPREGTRLESIFPRIVEFGSSGGQTAQDFFSVGIQTAQAFTNAPASPAVNVPFADQSCLQTSVNATGNISILSNAVSGPVHGIRVDNFIYVAEYSSGVFSRIDVNTGARTVLFNIGSSTRGVTKLGDFIYFVSEGAGSVLRYGLLNSTVTTVATGLSPVGDLVNDGTFLYSAEYYNGRVMKINPNDGTKEVFFQGLSGPYALGLVDNTLYVSEYNAASLSAINLSSKVKTTFIANSGSVLGIAITGNLFYTSDGSSIKQYALDTATLLKNYSNSQSYGIFADPVGQQIIMFNYFSNNIRLLR